MTKSRSNTLFFYSLYAVLIVALLLGCAPDMESKTQTELMVFVAMSLKKPMTEIAAIYESNYPGTKVNLNCAGTSSLVAQVVGGAPADVFASASLQDMDTLLGKGLVDPDTVKVFAVNSVVLVSPAGNKGELKSFENLVSEKVKWVAVGNPKLAPVGIYADEVLVYLGIKDKIKDKLIYCDQVAQVCDYTAQGEVDAGIVYLTDYLSRQDRLALVSKAVENAHRAVKYPVAVIKQSRNKQGAGNFITLLCSDKGKSVLSASGFRVENGVNN